MRFLYLAGNETWDQEICKSLEILEQEIAFFSFPEEIKTDEFVILSESNRYALVETLQRRDFDAVFSLSYIHEVSVFCNMLGVLYLSWTFMYPNMDLMRNSITNPCNCFFISDSREIERLKKLGAENVFYLPPAALGTFEDENDFEESALKEAGEIRVETGEDDGTEEKVQKEELVSYIGKILETNEAAFFGEDSELSAESRGYLDGLVHCQRVVYGMDILEDAVPAKVLAELKEKYPLQFPADVIAGDWDIYVKKWINDRVSSQERLVLVQGINNVVTVFSEDERMSKYVTRARIWKEEFKREDIITSSKINFYLTDRQAGSAIEADILEIMACGGFLLCNFCPEMEDFFVAGEDYVYFEDELDLKQKVNFYLKEEEKRKQIAQSGCRKVRSEHLMIHRIEKMLQILLYEEE